MKYGYSRINTPSGKFYGPWVGRFEMIRHLKSPKKTATEALEYARKFTVRFERLKREEKEVAGS